MNKERNLGFELLRLISMFSIVYGHIQAMTTATVFNPLSYLGDINCFVLITGYFMIDGKFKSQRFFRLAFETIFYCFIITLIFFIFAKQITTFELLKSSFPFAPTRYSYWFINKFLALIVLQPFLVKLVSLLNRRKYQLLLFALLMINSTLVVAFPFSSIFNNGWSLSWMITVFLIGGYIKKYDLFAGFKHWGGVWIVSVILMWFSGKFFSNIIDIQYNQWFFFLKSLSMFMWIKQMSLSSSNTLGKAVKWASQNVLAVYLIHNQVILLPVIISLGAQIIPDGAGAFVQTLILSAYTLVVMFSCILIDKVRVWLFEKCGIMRILNSFSAKFDEKLSHWMNYSA